MTLIAAQNITVRFGSTDILSGVSLAVQPAEIVTIVGPNGSGKSTLLRAILGIQPLAAGTLNRAPNLRIGYVPQRLHIDRPIPMTARRFLSLPQRCTDAQATAVLARCGVAGVENRQLADLSGGQLQRVLLARALLNEPDILILDEPTQGLDQPGEAAFYQLIADVRRDTGAAVLLVSHDLHVVMAASDRVICLNGHICCEGTPDVVRDAPEYRALFGFGTQGALALYRHDHDHSHGPSLTHVHGPNCGHDHGHSHHTETQKEPHKHA
ncbi:metal ABC transporter ATP-binding protein [Pseudorhodobacter ferrugineus]|uniref:metal ABC transporter ATP-binding protein n=1 Tax=Pseudorhodobacter ferrugineus TaxID=77008 RepID=UPI0003B604A1|nr:metal ABC transporter ATP-binding protein [Pseudorhodobacter ferrugineus]